MFYQMINRVMYQVIANQWEDDEGSESGDDEGSDEGWGGDGEESGFEDNEW